MSNFTQYIGCFHIHMPLKYYNVFIENIANEASKSNLNFIFLSPHTPENKQNEQDKQKYIKYFQKEGYYNKLMIFTGEEIDECSDKNHIVAYGPKEWVGKTSFENSIPIINKSNGLMFIAHPFGKHRIFISNSNHCWNKGLIKITGIEIWSLLFDLVQNRTLFTLPYNYLCFPHNLRGPNQKTLELWDEYLKEKKTIGIAGLDIHKLLSPLSILDIKNSINYKFVFKILRNHILCKEKLTGIFEKDKTIILESIKAGRLFFANDFLMDSSEFFMGNIEENKTIGDIFNQNEEIILKLPYKSYIVIKSNGKTLWAGEAKKYKIPLKEKGFYRAEIFLYNKPWIFTNPVFVI